MHWVFEWYKRGATFEVFPSIYRADRFTGPLYFFISVSWFLRVYNNAAPSENYGSFLFEISEGLNACAAVMAWVRVLYFFEPQYEEIGVTMATVRRMIADVRNYAIVLLIFLFGFSHSMTILFRHEEVNHSFSTAGGSFVNLFFFIFNLDAGIVLDEENAVRRSVGILLLGLYETLVVIIFLNLIIAVMTNTYESVMENSKAEWLLQRAKFVVKMEDQITYSVFRWLLGGNDYSSYNYNDDNNEPLKLAVIERSDGTVEIRLPRKSIPRDVSMFTHFFSVRFNWWGSYDNNKTATGYEAIPSGSGKGDTEHDLMHQTSSANKFLLSKENDYMELVGTFQKHVDHAAIAKNFIVKS